MTFHTIAIQTARRYGIMRIEETAAAAVTPGDLLEYSAGNVQPHSTAAGTDVGSRMVALETMTPATGTTPAIDQDYAAGDRVYVGLPVPGDVLYMWLATGSNVAKGDSLESAGSGALKAATTGAVVGIAAEALNNASGSNVRIKVRII
jgi:hypothetical protein